jgi:hypothetical protein
MIGRAWWDNFAVAIMRGSSTTTILRKLSWWRWSTILRKLSWRRWSNMSHWLVVRRGITGIGYCISHVGVVRMTIILRRVSTISLMRILLILGIASIVASRCINLRSVLMVVTPLRISHSWW